MENLLTFRLLADELTDDEFKQFLCGWLEQYGRMSFTTLLFNAFKNQPKSINPFTNIISNIMNKRESIPDERSHTIDELPNPLISDFASYLSHNDYIKLSRINRKLYIGCYSPSKICNIDYKTFIYFVKIPHALQFNLKRYKSINCMAFNLKGFNEELSFHNQTTWKNTNNIKSLLISNDCGTPTTIDTFIYRNPLNFATLKSLDIRHFVYPSTDGYVANATKFCSFLGNFPMIEALQLNNIWFQGVPPSINDPFDEIKKWFPKLIAFRYWGQVDVNLIKSIIIGLAEQLQVLSIQNVPVIIPPNGGFPKLRELILWDPIMNTLNAFQSVTSLETVMIVMNGTGDNMEDILKRFTHDMLINQMKLKYMTIFTNATRFQMLAIYMESVIYSCKHQKRDSKELMINVVCNNWDYTMDDWIFGDMFRLFKAMKTLNVENIRLRFVFQRNVNIFDEKANDMIMKDMLRKLGEIKQDYFIDYGNVPVRWVDGVSKYGFKTVISNKGCKIQGYEHNFFEYD